MNRMLLLTYQFSPTVLGAWEIAARYSGVDGLPPAGDAVRKTQPVIQIDDTVKCINPRKELGWRLPADLFGVGLGRVTRCRRLMGSASLCAALFLCGACAYRAPAPAAVIQPLDRRTDCAEMLIDEQGNCRSSSRSHGSASEDIGTARRRPMRRIRSPVPPPDRDALSTAFQRPYVGANFRGAFTVENQSVGSAFLGAPATFSSNPSGVLGGIQFDYNYQFSPQWLRWRDRIVTP